MKTMLQFVRKKISVVVIALLASAPLAPFGAMADDATTQQQSQAYQKAVQQENLQKEMASIQAELSSMREEMKQLLPGDVAMVDRAFKEIDSLSANEMKATIESLRAASHSGDLKTQLEQLASAYKNQTSAEVKIKNISGELSARGIRDDATQKLEDLLKRQVTDMDEVSRLGQMSQAPGGLRDNFQQRYQVVVGDQVSLTNDLKAAIQSINDAAANLPEDARKFMVAASGIIAQQRLADNATGAVSLTQNGPFAQAVTVQGAVVDTLAMVIHALSSDEKVLQQLQELSTSLGQIIDDQKGLETAMAGQRRGNFGYDMQKRQIDLSDRSGAARAELTPLNSHAAGLVQEGQVSMEKAVSVVGMPGRQQDRNQIAPSQEAAIASLTAAKKEIDQQIAMLDANKAPTTAELIADLESLLREVQQAAMDQARTAQAAQTPNSPFMPTAAAQKAFHDHVDSLQQRALPVSPDAAQAIGEASQQLSVAASAAQQPAMATAHVAAAQYLAKAADILARQLAALNGDAKADAAIAQAIQKLDEAMKQTDAAKTDLNSDKAAEAATQLATAQQDVAAAQQAVAAAQQDAAAATPPGTTPPAAAPTAAAAAALAQANAAAAAAAAAAGAQQAPAAQTNTAAAQAAEAQAMAALQQAQAGMQAAEAAAAGDAAAADAAAAAEAGQGEGAGEGAGAGAGEGEGQGQGQGQGEGEGAGSGAGVGMGPAMDPGQGDAPGQQMNSDQTGQGANGMENTALAMKGGGAGGGTPGALGNFGGTGGWNGPVQVVSGLSPHDRAAVAQLQNEKPPREFVPEVQQYYKNLADGSGL